jgi:RNA polymerase sigma-70 factor, ECF subfamily
MDSVIKIAIAAGHSVKDFARRITPFVIPNDNELLRLAKSGDTRAFSELVKRHQQFIIRQAYAYLGDNESARDAAQEIFIKAFEGLPYLENTLTFKSWLYRITKNHCLNMLRRRKIETGQSEYDLITQPTDVSLKHRLMKAIRQLEESHQEILILRYYQDMKYEEIAEFLDISLGSVKIRLFRAKKELKAILGDTKSEMR